MRPLRALIRILPDFLVKIFARPYVAGDSLDKAMAVGRRILETRGLMTTLDLLYEDISDDAQVAEVRRVYGEMVDACASLEDPKTRASVSLKPSSFTTEPLNGNSTDGVKGSEEAIRAIVQQAAERKVALTIDMENRHWTSWTLDLARRIYAEGATHVGIVLQTRLERTAADLDALPAGIRVRLVIGIYKEPKDVATLDKAEMKRRMLSYAEILLERGHFVEFATHDEALIRRFLNVVVPRCGVSPDRYEVQMLYGVPRNRFQHDLISGKIGKAGPVRARLYVPFATSWHLAIAYLRRRLLESPTMVLMVLRNLPRRLFSRR